MAMRGIWNRLTNLKGLLAFGRPTLKGLLADLKSLLADLKGLLADLKGLLADLKRPFGRP